MQAKQKKKRNPFIGLIVKIAVIAAIGCLLYMYVVSFYRMDGNNMFPAVRDGDLCFILKTEKPRKDDIVLWKDEEGKLRLSRIVAAGGQTVVVNDDGLIVNNYAPAEYIFYETKPADNGIDYPVTLTENAYFVLNDFRQEDTDSRVFGEVKRENIVGKVFFLFRRREF